MLLLIDVECGVVEICMVEVKVFFVKCEVDYGLMIILFEEYVFY